MLVRFIGLADAVVLAPDRSTLLAREGQRHHLPEMLRADATVVTAGSDVERVPAAPRRGVGVRSDRVARETALLSCWPVSTVQ
ncbi:hypothetical protein [Micromonospora sp. AMSO31t]|uniref:hypothetical protein n=1 Tax=Micromonospora sp. AMSO31t TaxID=2650566 RepID=UPI00124B68D8|nr:hypothetical protein [Micromonospora sp. AMSO31t]KAB1915831.1 hypothetical protein F8274_02185 [Micromonospora sp. AMSO31t]